MFFWLKFPVAHFLMPRARPSKHAVIGFLCGLENCIWCASPSALNFLTYVRDVFVCQSDPLIFHIFTQHFFWAFNSSMPPMPIQTRMRHDSTRAFEPSKSLLSLKTVAETMSCCTHFQYISPAAWHGWHLISLLLEYKVLFGHANAHPISELA